MGWLVVAGRRTRKRSLHARGSPAAREPRGSGKELDGGALAAPLLVPGDRFVARALHDALNRPIQATTPHTAAMKPNIVRATYNEAGVVDRVDLWEQRPSDSGDLLDPATADVHVVTDVEYDAHGDRVAITYGNGTRTRRAIDPLTRRLMRITTTRPASFPTDAQIVQDLRYTYDPSGNATRLRDDGDLQGTVFFRNRRVDPSSDYTYDAGYRLIRATGREHLGQTSTPAQITDNDAPRTRLPSPGDGNAMASYVEAYSYDPLGNLLELLHQTSAGNWRRRYAYSETSRIEPGVIGNRLSATSLPGDPAAGPYAATYRYDAHGNAIGMPHLSVMTWNERDTLRSTARQVVTTGTPETTYYNYDATDHRLRKVTDRASSDGPGKRRSERISLGAIEIYREYSADGATLTLARETLTLVADRRLAALLETRTIGSDDAPARVLKYQYSNLIGSSTLELDDTANVVSYEEYYPYGSTSYQAVRSQTDTPKRIRHAGRRRDDENGFYYANARYYAPWLGRWFNPDPEGIADGPNAYLYVHGNPIGGVDPTGTVGLIFGGLTLTEIFLIGGAASAATGAVVIATHPPPRDWHPFTSDDEDDFPVPPPVVPIPLPVPKPPAAPPVPRPTPGGPNPWPPYPVTPPWAPPGVPPWIGPIGPVPLPLPFPGPFAPPFPTPPYSPTQPPSPVPSTAGPASPTKPKATPKADPKPSPKVDRKPKPDTDDRRRRKKEPLRYVTYTKTKVVRGKTYVYVGRTAGRGDPRDIIYRRDLKHHMTAKGYGPAVLDKSTTATKPLTSRRADPAYQAIRGREQQMIDMFGGAKSDHRPGSRSGNAIRGVAKDNRYGRTYDREATTRFGRVAPYTGD